VNLRTMHRRNDPETSIAAAKQILPGISVLQHRAYETLLNHFRLTGKGLTGKELQQPPEFREYEFSTVHERLTDLMQKGYVIDSGEKRDGLTVWEPIAMDHLAARLEAEAWREKPLF
jgi:hypothetical protein